jgi:hypothetical protein
MSSRRYRSSAQAFQGSSVMPDSIKGVTDSFAPQELSSTKSTLKNVAGTLSKWVPLLCAGTAFGIGIIALKEIKNVRKELIMAKKEQLTKVPDKDLVQRIENMDQQLRKITEYLSNQSKPKTSPKIIPQAVKKDLNKVNIVNEDEDDEEEEVEIEIEVTDDEKE